MIEELLIGLVVGFVSYPLFMRFFWPPILDRIDSVVKSQKEKLRLGKKSKRTKTED